MFYKHRHKDILNCCETRQASSESISSSFLLDLLMSTKIVAYLILCALENLTIPLLTASLS